MNWLNFCTRTEREQGASLVEFAVASTVLFSMLFAIIEMGMALYCYTFVNEAAREAARYASVRGQNSCTTDSVSDSNCNLGPTAVGSSQNTYTTQPLQTYVQGLTIPFASSTTVTATWWSPTTSGGNTVWTNQCTTQVDNLTNPTNSLLGGGNTQCNYPGHAVQVVVTYPFSIAMPFLPANTLLIKSTSEMVINQ